MNKKVVVEEVLNKILDANATVGDWINSLSSLNKDHFVDVTELDDAYELSVWYHRDETDDECSERIRRKAQVDKIIRHQRYIQYLELKKEFEND